MNLQPFYELRERLVFAAAAGTQLIPEDFRLREAGKRMEAYGKVSPVFAKISQMAVKLSDGEEEERTETLLDLLGLLDAFLITQGQSQVDGEIKEIQAGNGRSMAAGEAPGCRNIPYSRLYPLQEALTSTGSGRQSLLSEAYKEDPDLFSDYRIRPLLVQALGDSYGEIADMVCRWIIKIGRPMLPLLKDGFQPGGNRDMVRRVNAISAIAKAEENDFYRKNLEESRKEIRAALICALHHHQDNAGLLFDLLKTERGKMKNMVLWSLSFMDGEDMPGFWREYSFTDVSQAALLLRDSNASYIPRFLADMLRKEGESLLKPEASEKPDEALEDKEKDEKGKQSSAILAKEKQERKETGFLSLLNACGGRMDEEIRRAFEWMAGEKGLKKFRKDCAELMAGTVFSDYRLDDRNSREYENLAIRLLEAEDAYIEPVFAAALLSRPSSQVYETFREYFEHKDKGKGTGIFRVMQRISYDPDKGYVVYFNRRQDSYMDPSPEKAIRVLEHGLDFRWYPLLISNKSWCPKTHGAVYTPYNGFDALLYRLKRSDVEELRRVYNEYFYARAMREGPSSADVAILKENGWTDFKGFVEKGCIMFQNTAWTYRIRELIRELPIEREQIIQELESVKNVWAGKTINGVSFIDRWLEQLHNGTSADEII